MEEFKKISNVEVAHIAWNILQTMHEDTKVVKINKFQQLTTRFESIRMSDNKSFNEFYAKLNDVVNSAYNLDEIYDQPKIVRKILRSLTENFRLCLFWVKIISGNAFPEMRVFGWSGKQNFPEIDFR